MIEPLKEASWDLYEMIQAFLQAPSYHVYFEIILILWIVWLVLIKSYKPVRVTLTEKEKEMLIEEWQPEPLVPDVAEDNRVLQNINNRIVDSKVTKYVSINGMKCLNLATFNFLCMVGKNEIEESALKALRKYGVGACGPRGFYGTMDVHLELEEKLAKFMNTEEALIYSYGFATISSAIPAYSKRGDVIFCDEGVCLAIQKGILASRSKVSYFKHNDMDDLERLLKLQEQDDKRNPKKAKVTRRFMVVEGLYINHGDLCPLPKLVELKWKYKVRIFMDESMSFGVLGKTGKGVTEHYGISIDEVDLITGSMENSLGGVGGFCCGKSYVVDHQRLSGLGYCFSASQPPMLASAVIKALEILEKNPVVLADLESNAKYMHEALMNLPGIHVGGIDISPIKHLTLEKPTGQRHEDENLLQSIVEKAQVEGVAITLAAYLENEETFLPNPSIRISLNNELTQEDMKKAIEVLQSACEKLLA